MAYSDSRFIVQDILTKKFLTMELDVSDPSVSWPLSGPQAISGNFPIELKELRDLGMKPWGCWIHHEEDGEIRASGILQPPQIDENETLTLDAVGVTSYLHDTPYMGQFDLVGTDPASGQTGRGLGLDPADIARDLWQEAQAYPNSDLGVFVTGTTPRRLGTPKVERTFDATNPDTGQTETVSFESGPYSKLEWWELADLGSTFDDLAKSTPFDYVERCAWNSDKTDVLHWVEIGYPRIGRQLNEVRFEQELNLDDAIRPEEPDDRYASEVIVLGAGEGSARVRGRAARPVPGRLRRVKTIDDKSVKTNNDANALAWHELDLCQALDDVTEIVVQARDATAPLGSYGPGDDVPLAADVPWRGELRLFQRILNIDYSPVSEQVKLSMRSSSSFSYGGPAT